MGWLGIILVTQPFMRPIRRLFFLLFLLLPGTGLAQDTLVWEGVSLRTMATQPTASLDTAFRRHIREQLIESDDGQELAYEFGWYDSEEYQSWWSVVDKRLCLDSIGLFRLDGDAWRRVWRDAVSLKDLFHGYWQDGHIVATWYSGTFKAYPRDAVPIVLSGRFYTTWDREWVFTFRDGMLLSARYDDHRFYEGSMSYAEAVQYFRQSLQDFPYERFPALAGVSFEILIRDCQVDETGRMCDFTPVLHRRPSILDQNPEMEAALLTEIKKRMLQTDMSIYRIDDAYSPAQFGGQGMVRGFSVTFPPKERQEMPE